MISMLAIISPHEFFVLIKYNNLSRKNLQQEKF